MNKTVFDSGDNNGVLEHVDKTDSLSSDQNMAEEIIPEAAEASEKIEWKNNDITTKTIADKKLQLKERIDQCKNILATLKSELDEEKCKLEKEIKVNNPQQNKISSTINNINNDCPNEKAENLFTPNMFAATVHNKLRCDENLIEYEKQLQKYQNTLNMAQIEKKNAIRKQMLAKAYKLKLLEVENQCNVELLRIKQSIQCLEPLKMIVEKWKTTGNENEYDLNNFELIPRYPELSPNSDSDVSTNFNNDNA
ncbi:unnamed protein product, partial [Brenthis ino]